MMILTVVFKKNHIYAAKIELPVIYYEKKSWYLFGVAVVIVI